MYLEHFQLKELPFTLTPNTGFYCQLKGHQEAFNTLLFCLRSGEGFIKIIGEVGSGKTLLCRKLLESLGPETVTAYIPNPDLNPIELRKALSREIGIDTHAHHDQHELLNAIHSRLMSLHDQGKPVVFIIDECQAIPPESLEALRLLTNLETEKTKLLQVVLFGQPEFDERLRQPQFRQLQQRISFSHYLPLMNRKDLDNYLFHRLAKAGCTYGTIFSEKAKDALYKASLGVPRIVNILCHKAMLVAYGRGETQISKHIMRVAVNDSSLDAPTVNNLQAWITILASLVIILLAVYLAKDMM